jgi:hypothetical protein
VVAIAALAPRAAPHHKWIEISIIFDFSDCPKNMSEARQLPLLVSPTIANIRLYHVLVDGGAAINLISLAAFYVEACPFTCVLWSGSGLHHHTW